MNVATASAKGVQLSIDDLKARAHTAAEGLTDFGDPWFEVPLKKLVEFINTEGGLTSDKCLPVDILIMSLRDRLKLVDYLKRHPEVRDEKIQVAGCIIGLPRGGSTLAQRLLCSSKQLTSTRWWELLNPLPMPGEKPGDPTPRIEFAKATAEAMYEAWPDMRSMHQIEPEGYDEEVQLIERSLLCIMWPFYFHIPSYVPWMFQQDHAKAYDELKLWLQVLQHQEPSRRQRKWMLKSPHHLLGGGFEHALRIFPDAKMLMTHRAIEDVISSFCSLQAEQIKPFSNNFDQKKMGKHGIEWFTMGLKKMMEVRKTMAPGRFIDIQYKEILADPIGEFRRTMTAMGITVTPEDEADAKAWMAGHGRDTHPRHKYTPEENGMTRDELVSTFKFYRDAYIK